MKKILIAIIIVLLLIIAYMASYVIETSKKMTEQALLQGEEIFKYVQKVDELEEKLSKYESNQIAERDKFTFYAEVEKVDVENKKVIVKGLDFDATRQGKYELNISEDTWIVGNGQGNDSNLRELSDLKKLNHVLVQYTGVIETGTPDKISEVVKIQILDFEDK